MNVLGRDYTGAYKSELSTAEVRNALKINDRTIAFWLRDPIFRKIGIARKEEYRWIWNREKLVLWVWAVSKLPGEGPVELQREQENPPVTGWQRARIALGMPLDYLVHAVK